MLKGLHGVLGLLLLIGCTVKKSHEIAENQAVEIDSAREFYKDPDAETVYTYAQFAGVFDHESKTRGFEAVLSLAESGNDLSFIVSVSQGNCKGEAQGKITIIAHEENYYSGFFEQANCPLQFTLMLQEDKIDIKEINLCRLHENGCGFEGTYVKRKLFNQ